MEAVCALFGLGHHKCTKRDAVFGTTVVSIIQRAVVKLMKRSMKNSTSIDRSMIAHICWYPGTRSWLNAQSWARPARFKCQGFIQFSQALKFWNRTA